MPDMDKVRALLQDRKSPTAKKGRASAPFPVVMDADLAIELAQARQELANAEQAVTDWAHELAENDSRHAKPKPPAELNKRIAEAQKRVDEIKAEADEVTVILVLVAMHAEKQDELEKLHPPREGNKDDEKHGVNIATYPIERLRQCAAKVVDFDDNLLDVDPQDLIIGMSSGERDLACQVTAGISQQIASVPFYDASSQSRQRSGGKPRRP